MVDRVLAEIYEKYGEEAVFNYKRLRALLLDMRVPKKTVNLLSDIARIEYFRQFAVEIKHDATAREKLVYSTASEYAFERQAIEYGVECWARVFAGGADGLLPDIDADGELDSEIWPEEKAELVAAALRELMRG